MATSRPAEERVSIEDAVRLGSVDSIFYSQFFFPKTVRMEGPAYTQELWDAMENPHYRYFAAKIFRDGAKTTMCRLFASKRIAYGISHNIVYTSKSERHAARSVDWIKRQVEFNSLWASAFRLRKGSKWSDTECEIIHGVDEYPIRIIAVGITGQVRGINFDDYRPDLIVSDDSDDEESTGTPEQRTKANELFFGALLRSLAQPTDIPDAKAVALATPLAKGDIIDTCENDPTWKVVAYGCFNAENKSTWEAKFPTSTLLKEKEAYRNRNQLVLWMREMEVKIISEELASFRMSWLKFVDKEPPGCWYFVGIDPAASDSPTADDFAMGLWAVLGANAFLVDSLVAQGVMPDVAVAQFFGWRMDHYIRYVVCETVAYQRILAWYFRREMEKQRIFVPVREWDDKRRKDDRILQNILAYAPMGNLHVLNNPSNHKFVAQYQEWRPGAKIHDDALDMAGISLASLKVQVGDLKAEFKRLQDEEEDMPKIRRKLVCP